MVSTTTKPLTLEEFLALPENKLKIVEDFNQFLIVPKFAETVTLNAENVFNWLQLG
jgi:hypothetical protein